jgi:hypothetical protein
MTKPSKTLTANEVIAATRDDHNWRHDATTRLDITSTGGIQRNIQALWSAVQALADHADGIATGQTDAAGYPIKADSEADKPAVPAPVV